MQHDRGTIKTWKDDKGFGFIRPEIAGLDVFVHIRHFGSIGRKPRVGDTVFYQPMKDGSGRWRAAARVVRRDHDPHHRRVEPDVGVLP